MPKPNQLRDGDQVAVNDPPQNEVNDQFFQDEPIILTLSSDDGLKTLTYVRADAYDAAFELTVALVRYFEQHFPEGDAVPTDIAVLIASALEAGEQVAQARDRYEDGE